MAKMPKSTAKSARIVPASQGRQGDIKKCQRALQRVRGSPAATNTYERFALLKELPFCPSLCQKNFLRTTFVDLPGHITTLSIGENSPECITLSIACS